jgi:hypothetical protein
MKEGTFSYRCDRERLTENLNIMKVKREKERLCKSCSNNFDC